MSVPIKNPVVVLSDPATQAEHGQEIRELLLDTLARQIAARLRLKKLIKTEVRYEQEITAGSGR